MQRKTKPPATPKRKTQPEENTKLDSPGFCSVHVHNRIAWVIHKGLVVCVVKKMAVLSLPPAPRFVAAPPAWATANSLSNKMILNDSKLSNFCKHKQTVEQAQLQCKNWCRC